MSETRQQWLLARTVLALIVAVALALGLGPGAAAAAGGEAPPPPDVLGLSLDAAVQTLQAAELSVELVPEVLPDGVDRGLVVVADQTSFSDPDGGPAVGSRLLLGARVPEVVGLSPSDAADAITATGLLSRVIDAPDGDPDGVLVDDQSPEAGKTLVLGETVTLRVVEQVRVPAVVGRTADEAAELVQAAGLDLDVQGDGESDPVRTQQPPPGTPVAPGSSVTVTLGVGSPTSPVPVTVPDLRGLDQDDARDRLDAVGLTLEAGVDGDPARATAVDQDPDAGTRVIAPVTVRVDFAAGVGSERPWRLLLGALVALAAGVLAATAAGRLVRRRRERTWVQGHVRVHGHLQAADPARVDPAAGAASHSVRLQAHTDPGHLELHEARR